jgi:hypothetical protein
MRTAVAAAGLFALSLLVGCEGGRQPGPPVALKSFVLHDVQGLHGGQAIWAAEDGTAFIQSVEVPPAGQAGLWEKRYKAKVTPKQWAEVERLVGAHGLLSVKMPERPGIPDEAHPIIVLVTRTGTTVKVRKRGDDKHPDFDPVYAYLLGLCRAGGELVHEGAFDWDWRPEGFERPW